jgi:hypothetical protein
MIYDYKSDELTQEVYISCICPIVDDIIDEYFTLRRYENLSIYVPSYIAREIIGRLLEEVDDLWVHTDSDISLIYADGNDLVVTIACDGMIFIESAKNNDVIKSNEDCCLTYFYDGLGQKDLNALEENAESILVFGFEEDTCEGCKSDNTELSIDSDGDKYSIKIKCDIDADEEMEIIKDMENHMERMNDMFREMDNFRRLFRW